MWIFQSTFYIIFQMLHEVTWFVLHINKMNWDCCLFCDEPKSEELRERVKASSKEKAERRKLKKLTRKLHHSSINLLNKIYFRWKNSLVKIMNKQYSKYLKQTMQSTITIVFQTIGRNWRDVWRKEREMMISRKKLKRISDLKEAMSKRHHRSFWESISVCSVE